MNNPPPHSVNAEQGVLGSLMLDKLAWGKVAGWLAPEDFYRHDHHLIFKAMAGLTSEGKPLDVITLAETLEQLGWLAESGGLSYLASLAKETPSAANIDAYAAIVREKADLRRLGELGADIQALASVPGQRSVSELLAGMRGRFEAIDKRQREADPKQHGSFGTISAQELCAKEFPPIKWAVPALIPAGAALLAGAPKIGKSWLALDISIAVASGGAVLGKIQVDPGTVLYLALEDNERRLKSRLLKRLGDAPIPDALHFKTEWPRLDQGAAERLRDWMDCHPDTRLVIVDTLARIRPPSNGKKTLYTEDYDIGKPLLDVARDYGVAILLVHHTKKGESDDPLEMVSGSFGLTGGVDNVLILQRNRGTNEASLYVTGRDIEHETKYGLGWDGLLAAWSLEGQGPQVGLSPERRRVYDIIAKHGPITGRDIASALHPGVALTRDAKEYTSTRFLLKKLVDDGVIHNTPHGYQLTSTSLTQVDVV